MVKICSARCSYESLSVCPLWGVGVTICHPWVSFQVILPRREVFTAILRSYRLFLTRTQRQVDETTHGHTDRSTQLRHTAAVNTYCGEICNHSSLLFKSSNLNNDNRHTCIKGPQSQGGQQHTPSFSIFNVLTHHDMEGGGEEGGLKVKLDLSKKTVTQNAAQPEYQQEKLDQTKAHE